jgi:drug/metabolite transporter (DMT)-like permease
MKPRTRAEVLLFLCTFVWGGTFVVVKGGLDDASPLTFLAIRFAIATVLFAPFVARFFPLLSGRTIVHGVVLGALLCAGFILQTVGLEYTTASKSAFVTGLLVVFTPLFQVLVERRAPGPGNILGVVLVVAGLYLLTSPEGSSFNVGDLMTLICAALFGLYIVCLDLFSKVSNVWMLAFLQFAVTLLATAIGAFFFEGWAVTWTPGFLMALGYLAVLATVVTLAVQTRFQKDTTPTRAAVIFSLEPVLAALLAYWVRDEVIGGVGVLGGGLIFMGLIASQLSDRLLPSWQATPSAGE